MRWVCRTCVGFIDLGLGLQILKSKRWFCRSCFRLQTLRCFLQTSRWIFRSCIDFVDLAQDVQILRWNCRSCVGFVDLVLGLKRDPREQFKPLYKRDRKRRGV